MMSIGKTRRLHDTRRTIADFYRAGAACIGLSLTIAISMAKERSTLQYGVYDPEKRFAHADQIGVEHIFIAWLPSDVARLRYASEYAASRNRRLMVTIEPWQAHGRTAETLLSDINNGIYDADIRNVASALGGLNRPVFVRWGHEMEDVTGRYPWASHDAQGYIKAYRYFVDHCRSWSHGRFYFVWSPKGRQRLSAYYPGADYVDYIGVSVYGLEQWDIGHTGKAQDFNDRFREIYSFVSRYNKPVMIAELGVSGGATYRHRWFSQLAASSSAFPRLRIVVYFNAKEPDPWPDGYGSPDWRVDPVDLSGSG
jgi:beta-mannanase